MMNAESSSGLITSANTFHNRGSNAGERVGIHLSFPTCVTAFLFRVMSGGVMVV